MKIFIYKTLIVILSFYLLFQLTVGQIFRSYETKIEDMLYNKQGRELILEKIKKEIRAANQKENIFTSEEKELFKLSIKAVEDLYKAAKNIDKSL